MGNENFKGVHIDEVGGKIRNRKKYAQQHRKRFVTRFTWLARVITFEMFSMMVDEALDKMKTMLESNTAMQELVSSEAGESGE